ncbi:protein kinase superfamily protein isoform X2 [Wolffia australiana]
MAGAGGTRVVGDYLLGRMIGRGSFSDVWLARHRLRGTEAAVKEIPIDRLSRKLRDSLLSEIVILKRIDHPNIIALYDIIEHPKTIYIVLEFCRGGDLSLYIQRHGRVPEATAKYFMRQLAEGLQVLQKHNLIHRDLKPQNLLLSSNDEDATLKIADFGFARPLQPRGLAETLCGSPLYMAPEIMQLQKYDAKADLWSIGVILFQLVTGKTPFNGNSQIELLQNIVKSTDLHFPRDSSDLSADCMDLCRKLLRRNPVERLTFEEFFNHRFICDHHPQQDDPLRASQAFTDSTHNVSEESSQEECLPFLFDDEPKRLHPAPKNSSISSSRVHTSVDRPSPSPSADKPPAKPSKDVVSPIQQSPARLASKVSTSASSRNCALSAPIKITGATASQESPGTPSLNSQGSTDMADALEQPSTHCQTRIRSLQQCAAAVSELVEGKIEERSYLEALSIQLVVLAIWKQALHICHAQAASSRDIGDRKDAPTGSEEIGEISSQIERAFLLEVGRADDLARELGPIDEAAEMPDAMEMVFQAALSFGRNGAVDELMENIENAAAAYSKAVRLLVFLLVEAPSLILNPPFSLTNSDRFRLRSYIDVLSSRQSQSRSARINLLKCDGHGSPI